MYYVYITYLCVCHIEKKTPTYLVCKGAWTKVNNGNWGGTNRDFEVYTEEMQNTHRETFYNFIIYLNILTLL